MAYDTEIRSGSDRKGTPRSIQVDSSANEAGAHEHDEHGAHREAYNCHH